METLEQIHGAIERVTYHSAESGYCVLKVKAKGQRDLVTVVGSLASVSAGESVDGEGVWSQHPEYGLQFKASSLRTVHPTSLEGMERYLGSGMVKGIGPHFARKLIERFGLTVFETIENQPHLLASVPGIGPVRRQKILEAWKDQRVIRDIMVFLQSHGVSTFRAVRIYKTYGEKAIEEVSKNPYQLARDVSGIGFKSADLIAGHLGIAKDSLIRARAGLHHVLWERVGEGHCAYPVAELIEKAIELLEISKDRLEEALKLELQSGALHEEAIDGTLCVYPKALYAQEGVIAEELQRLKTLSVPWGSIDLPKALKWVESELNLKLAFRQREAVEAALHSKLTVITGGPGTGKTTLTRAIVRILQAKKMRIGLCSPTGRAAKRLAECTGFEAKTIHRFLGIERGTGGFLHHAKNPLPFDCVLIDEVSMVDVPLMASLLRAMALPAAIIFVGDVDQLPSVGPGEVLRHFIESQVMTTVRLTEIFRQCKDSDIISAAHSVNEGNFPRLSHRPDSDFFFIECGEPIVAAAKVVELVTTRLPKHYGIDPKKDIQVLAPMNRGNLGVKSLNMDLQRALNPNPVSKVERFGVVFASGDKVIVTENDYDKDVFNGDIGFIQTVDLEEQCLTVNIDGREVIFQFSETDILSLAYAISIHKSQGSEYPAVVLPLSMQHYLMLKRKLFYTGITRGKRLVVVVGEKKAMAIAIKSKEQGRRWSGLLDRLKAS